MRPKQPRATTRGYSKMVIHAATDRLWEVSELAVLPETKSDSCSLTDVGFICLDLLPDEERTRFEAIRKTELFLPIWLDNNPVSTAMRVEWTEQAPPIPGPLIHRQSQPRIDKLGISSEHIF